MAVQLNLGLRIPLVKLDIDYNDRPSRVVLQENDLTFSQDGTEVRLRYETIDKLCRSNKKIDSKVPLDILYFN